MCCFAAKKEHSEQVTYLHNVKKKYAPVLLYFAVQIFYPP